MNAPLILHCCANTKNIICVFRESNNIRIRVPSFLESRIIFVFVFGRFLNALAGLKGLKLEPVDG